MHKLVHDFSWPIFGFQFLLLAAIGLWIYCLIDVLRNDFQQNDKLIWALVIILLPVVGSVLYLFIGNNKKVKHN
ncbi:MAG TPA: PLD nuclease N-terminal domain-containing protein [Flavobacteriaceae bacterium]|nr:PLD nuclease N-terminal domain-containing protein [Flavobacteriaceae bacterium]